MSIEDEAARILDTCAARPMMPDRTLDPRTTGLLKESIHTTIDAIERNSSIDVSGPQMAKVCYKLDDKDGSFFDWAASFFGDNDLDLTTIIAYVPMVHSCIPDPWIVATERGITDISDTNPAWRSLVDTLLPDSSAKITAASSVKLGDKDLDPGQWVWVEYTDSVNMTNGVLLNSIVSTPDLSTSGATPVSTRAAFEGGTPANPVAPGDYAAANMKYFGKLRYPSRLKRKAYDMIILHDGGRWSYVGKDKSGEQLKADPGSVASLVGMFNLKKRSTHYFIDGDGTTYQLMDESLAGIHAGAANPTIKAPNTRSIGIDLRNMHIFPPTKTITTKSGKKRRKPHPEGWTGKYTDAQYDALNLLIEDISARRGIPRDDKHILAHFEAVKKHHNDPLPDFKWLRVHNLQYDHREQNGPGMASIIKSSDTKTT